MKDKVRGFIKVDTVIEQWSVSIADFFGVLYGAERRYRRFGVVGGVLTLFASWVER